MEKKEQEQLNYAFNAGTPGKKYLWMILYVPLYLTAFVLLQLREVSCTVVYIPLDDMIPFCQYFALFYWAWYLLMAGTGVFLLLKDRVGFRNYMLFMMTGFSICLLTYWLYPTCQQLRPGSFERESIFTRAMEFIYRIDPSMNVLPSMHVAGSAMCAAALVRSPAVKGVFAKAALGLLGFLCAVSTVFVKQHSALDVIASVGICIPIFLGIYAPWTRKQRRELSPPEQMRWLILGLMALAVAVLCLWYTVKTLAL